MGLRFPIQLAPLDRRSVFLDGLSLLRPGRIFPAIRLFLATAAIPEI